VDTHFGGADHRSLWSAAFGERWQVTYDGIPAPGGFGKRGIDGMLNAIR